MQGARVGRTSPVATVGEAEVFAQQGFDSLFVAYPLWLDDRPASVGAVGRAGHAAGSASTRVEGARRAGWPAPGVTGLVEVDSATTAPVWRRGRRRGGGRCRRGRAGGAGAFTFPGHSWACLPKIGVDGRDC